MQIGGKRIGGGTACIVAEAGSSHAGDLKKAYQLIDCAAEAGADCVKFQAIFADEIEHPLCGDIELPAGKTPIYRRFKELERGEDFYARIKNRTEERGLLFLCSAFGTRSARMLRSLNVQALKIASPELNHYLLLKEVAGYGLPWKPTCWQITWIPCLKASIGIWPWSTNCWR